MISYMRIGIMKYVLPGLKSQLFRSMENNLHLFPSPINSGNNRISGKLLTSPTMSLERHTSGFSCMSMRGLHISPRRLYIEDTTTKDIAVWHSLKEVRKSPVPALTLGLLGLCPFVGAPVYMMTQGIYMSSVAFAQVAYGASILSFLGGIRWGFTIPEETAIQPNWINLGYSTLPSLIAWSGLLMNHPYSLLTVMGGLTFMAYGDMALYGYPPWFKGLRFLLSFVAILSLWTTFMCSYALEEKEHKD